MHKKDCIFVGAHWGCYLGSSAPSRETSSKRTTWQSRRYRKVDVSAHSFTRHHWTQWKLTSIWLKGPDQHCAARLFTPRPQSSWRKVCSGTVKS